jgi:hypothetical protein
MAKQARDQLAQAQRTQREKEEFERTHQRGFRGRMGDIYKSAQLIGAKMAGGLGVDVPDAQIKGLAYDLSLTPATDNVANLLLGPRGIGGSVIGLVPPAVRGPIGGIIQPTMQALDDVRRELIIEPLSRGLSGANPLGGLSDLSGFDDPDLPNTIGRSVISWTDLDPDSGWGQTISGGLDLLSAIFLDPTAIGAKGSLVVRNKVWREAGFGVIDNPAYLAKVVDSQATTEFLGKIEKLNGSEITDRFFANHTYGYQIGHAFEEAGTVEGKKLVLKSMLGDGDALAELTAKHSTAGTIIENLQSNLDSIQRSILDTPDYFPGTKAALEGSATDIATQLSAQQLAEQQAKRALDMWSELERLPKETGAGRLRTGTGKVAESAGARSDWYQDSGGGRAVQTIFNRLPKNTIDLNRPTAAVEMKRVMVAGRVPIEEQDVLMRRFLSEDAVGSRAQIAEEIEDRAIKQMGDDRGLLPEEVDDLVNRIRSGRKEMTNRVNQKAYASEGRDIIDVSEPGGPTRLLHAPLSGKQTANYVNLSDFHAVRHAVTEWGQFKARFPTIVGAPVNIANEINNIWRQSAVGKIATSALIQMDAHVRTYVKFGALANMREWYRQTSGTIGRTLAGAERGERGLVPLSVRGVRVPAALGETAEEATLYKGMVSGRGFNRRLIQKEAEMFETKVPKFLTRKNRLPDGQVPPGSSWGTVPNTDPRHLPAMSYVLNNHFGGDDALFHRLLQGETDEQIVGWLRSRDAADYTRGLELRMRNPEKWVADARSELDYLTKGDNDLRRLMLDQKVTPEDIERAMPNPETRPFVNGPITEQLAGKSQSFRFVQGALDMWFKTIFAMPDDVLSRQPTMRRFYGAEMTRLVERTLDGGVTLTDDLMQTFVKRARNKAIEETKRLLYDLSDQSRAAELLKFVVPFFEPMREQVTVYAQLAREAPQRLRRVYLALGAPARNGFLYDEKGNLIGADGEHRDPNTNEIVPDSQKGTRELIRIPLPGWAREVADAVPFFTGALGGKPAFTIDRNSIRVGFPQELGGFGPLVQIPVNKVVTNMPSLEDSLKFMIPFGVSQDSAFKQLTPSYLKQPDSAVENRTYAGLEIRNLWDKMAEFREDTGRVPTEDEKQAMIKDSIAETNNFWHLRRIVNFTAPFSVGFESPYKPYADAYRAAQSLLIKNPDALPDEDGNPRTADEWFLDTYGGEFQAVTQSVTKTMNGIPATVEDDFKAKQMMDLVERYPPYGGLIVGSDGAGEFSRAVWLSQLNRPLQPGSGENWRNPLTLQQAKDPEVEEAWIRYIANMDKLDAKMETAGLTNLNGSSPAAVQLKGLKEQMITGLEKEYPAWKREKDQFDTGKWEQRMADLKAISSNEQLRNRPEIQMLASYIQRREKLAATLKKRKDAGRPSTLQAAANADLRNLWEDYGNKLAQENLAFSDLFHRYLEHDPVVD